jgi:hypothetical protein
LHVFRVGREVEQNAEEDAECLKQLQFAAFLGSTPWMNAKDRIGRDEWLNAENKESPLNKSNLIADFHSGRKFSPF